MPTIKKYNPNFLSIGGYPIWVKEDVNLHLIHMLFQPEDFVVQKRKCNTMNKIVFGNEVAKLRGEYKFHGFRQTVKVCKDRLRIYGANHYNSKKAFEFNHKLVTKYFPNNTNYKYLEYEDYPKVIKAIIKNNKNLLKEPRHLALYESLKSKELEEHGWKSSYNTIFTILSTLSDKEIIEYDISQLFLVGNHKYTLTHDFEFDTQKIIILT